jgi:hypothetical protein
MTYNYSSDRYVTNETKDMKFTLQGGQKPLKDE